MEEQPNTCEQKIQELAIQYAKRLEESIQGRSDEMKADDTAHFLIYQVLGVSKEEGEKIDLYQNSGRFLYNNAGSFLEKATKLCFQSRFPESGSIKTSQHKGNHPKDLRD